MLADGIDWLKFYGRRRGAIVDLAACAGYSIGIPAPREHFATVRIRVVPSQEILKAFAFNSRFHQRYFSMQIYRSFAVFHPSMLPMRQDRVSA